VRRVVAVLFGCVLLASSLFGSLPLVMADYTVDHASFPPDLPGGVNNDGKVDIYDVVKVARSISADPTYWNPAADVNDDGKIDIRDLVRVAKLFGKQYDTSATPIAYSTSFEFDVPNDGEASVWYHVLVRFYVPSEVAGREFYLNPEYVDDYIRNVKIDCLLKYSGGHTACQPPSSISLGTLNQGYHLLEMEFGEVWAAGGLKISISTADGQKAQMNRLRIYVPNYGDAEVKYTVKSYTYFPYDEYFLVGCADDYINSVWVDASELWADWQWDMGPNYGALWNAGFCYPLGYEEGLRTVAFTFGEIWGSGLLDFQYVSRSNQKAKIGNPVFWSSISTSEASSYIKIYKSQVWIGSKWLGDAGTSAYITATSIRVLVNATADNPYYLQIPQEAQVSLILYPLPLQWPKPTGYVDIGVIVNLTYTYYDETSFCYSLPIWFEPYSIEVRTPEQGAMLYIPQTSMVFCTTSATSFITPQWKTYLPLGGSIMVGAICGYIGWYYSGSWFASVITGSGSAGLSWIFQNFFFADNKQLNSTTEYAGTPSYRKFSMNMFKTTEEQLLLSPPVSNQSSAFFFRIRTWSSFHCGSISIANERSSLASILLQRTRTRTTRLAKLLWRLAASEC